MTTLKLVAEVNEQHQLSATVPSDIPPGPVEIVLKLHDGEEDEAGAAWESGISDEWSAELSDFREDIYTLADGAPVDDRR